MTKTKEVKQQVTSLEPTGVSNDFANRIIDIATYLSWLGDPSRLEKMGGKERILGRLANVLRNTPTYTELVEGLLGQPTFIKINRSDFINAQTESTAERLDQLVLEVKAFADKTSDLDISKLKARLKEMAELIFGGGSPRANEFIHRFKL